MKPFDLPAAKAGAPICSAEGRPKTNELTGAALDWAVAKCEGYECEGYDEVSGPWLVPQEGYLHDEKPLASFRPSTNWAHGGPIIEREGINVGRHEWMGPSMEVISWSAERYATEKPGKQIGPTPLIAAMRCYVASRLGYEIEVPDKLQ